MNMDQGILILNIFSLLFDAHHVRREPLGFPLLTKGNENKKIQKKRDRVRPGTKNNAKVAHIRAFRRIDSVQ